MKTLCILTYLKCVNEDYIGMFSWWAISRHRKGHSYEARLFQSWHKMSAEGLEMTILNGQWCKQKKKKKTLRNWLKSLLGKVKSTTVEGRALKLVIFCLTYYVHFCKYSETYIFFSRFQRGSKCIQHQVLWQQSLLKEEEEKKTQKNPERLW